MICVKERVSTAVVLLFLFACAVGFMVLTPQEALAYDCCYQCPLTCPGYPGYGGVPRGDGGCDLVGPGHPCYNPLPMCMCQ